MSPSSQTSANHGKSTSGPKIKTSLAGKYQLQPSRHLHISPEFYYEFACRHIAKKASIKQLQPIPEAKGSEDDESPPYKNWHADYLEKDDAYEASEEGKAFIKKEKEEDAEAIATLKSGCKLVGGKGGRRKCKKT